MLLNFLKNIEKTIFNRKPIDFYVMILILSLSLIFFVTLPIYLTVEVVEQEIALPDGLVYTRHLDAPRFVGGALTVEYNGELYSSDVCKFYETDICDPNLKGHQFIGSNVKIFVLERRISLRKNRKASLYITFLNGSFKQVNANENRVYTLPDKDVVGKGKSLNELIKNWSIILSGLGMLFSILGIRFHIHKKSNSSSSD
ncbi:hypothetical protein LNQ82_04820 [Conchiformibius steedae DSM 2580]|uniref:Uncharacterized protein n=1 Tax=Conchiformibius steedae DSM 2580 TaxID=1121352 RepID=A0AAE9HV25_9NEIS|nr:hypothetical protein [Conchiformibius steedae]QMT33812.1 hypothetical protein H3L98_01895 [Conchiformibius steedae]URD68473.1 hypothetical protein LNQ82_04820 [Conchiformibius steedae DSM 2580]